MAHESRDILLVFVDANVLIRGLTLPRFPLALAAIQAGATYLVSTDLDLIVVDTSTEKLREQIIPIRPGDFLKQVLGWTSEELDGIERRTWGALERG